MEIELLRDLLLKVADFKKEIDKSFIPTKAVLLANKYEKYDIVVITASIDEYHSFSKYIDKTEIKEYSNDPTLYLKGQITTNKGELLSLIMPIPSEMGIASASINATKAIITFSPRYIFMVGICAGVKSVTNLGDVIIAEKTIDYNEVVEIENSDSSVRTKFMNTVLDITSTIKGKCQLFAANYSFDNDYIKETFNYSSTFKHHLGLLATGSALLRNGEKVKRLSTDYHNLKGIDMETYGVYKAVDSFESRTGEIQFLSIKAVSDYADNDKAKNGESILDKRGLALYNASHFLFNFIKTSL